MCIDLMLVKGVANGPTPADVDVVEAFGDVGYRSLGHALFSMARWNEDGVGQEKFGPLTATITPSEQALNVRVAGSGDVSFYLRQMSAMAKRYGFVTIDIKAFAVVNG